MRCNDRAALVQAGGRASDRARAWHHLPGSQALLSPGARGDEDYPLALLRRRPDPALLYYMFVLEISTDGSQPSATNRDDSAALV